MGTGDRVSTVKLFAYLDPTIQPEYLEPAALRWGGEQGKPGPTVESSCTYPGGFLHFRAAVASRFRARAPTRSPKSRRATS